MPMKCQIKWDTYTRTEWNDLLRKCPHSTLLQSYYYAQAIREVHFQGARHGLIIIDGVEAGIVQTQEVGLFGNLIHSIICDRGPCWFEGFGREEHINAFFQCINTEFPARFGRKRRFMLEYCGDKGIPPPKKLKKNDKFTSYKTFFVDLSQNIENINKNFKKSWRRNLYKSQKIEININIDEKLSTFSMFLRFYAQDRIQKGYSGPSSKFLASLCKYATLSNDCMILNAYLDDEIIGSILILTHGNCATYQVGWNTPQGRDKCAHHLLFWHAIQYLKKKGIQEFDLGGYNDDIDGIRRFKEGMGGHAIALIGSYI